MIKKVLKKKDTTESFEENLDVFLGILYIRRTTVNLNQLGMQLVLPIILDGMYKWILSSKWPRYYHPKWPTQVKYPIDCLEGV